MEKKSFFGMNMTFISSRAAKNCIFHLWLQIFGMNMRYDFSCLPHWGRFKIFQINSDSLVDKASASGAGGRRFDSQCRRHWVVLIWPVGEPPAS